MRSDGFRCFSGLLQPAPGTVALALLTNHFSSIFSHLSSPSQANIRRYGAPSTSSMHGNHHALFSQGNGLVKQPAAPRHPPTIEIVAAGFFCLIHEHTVILLKTIAPAARASSRHAMNQRKGNPISSRERAPLGFLVLKTWQKAG